MRVFGVVDKQLTKGSWSVQHALCIAFFGLACHLAPHEEEKRSRRRSAPPARSKHGRLY
jgi:hypothetical protein